MSPKVICKRYVCLFSNNKASNGTKKFKKSLQPLVKKYFCESYRSSCSIFDELVLEFGDKQLSKSQQRLLHKFMLIFLLGQLLDLPTLNAILSEYGISSNTASKRFAMIHKHLSISTLLKMFERIFERQISERLKDLYEKHESARSRELVTVLLDDSVFKQWLSSFKAGEDFAQCYGKFFSGQTNSCVYGFKVCCLGICIDGVYYPMYFEFVSKKKKTENGGISSSILAAQKLVNRYAAWKQKVEKEGLTLGTLHFSCDNGYSDVDLAQTCQAADLVYISVPKKSHLFRINGVKIKLSDWIKEEFLAAEKKHQAQQQDLSLDKRKPFVLRFKATYLSKGKSFTFIAFRLNGSKKVSVVYCTSDTIFAKTLRRHWFQRTYIEQFFKILKHMLHIQDSRTKNKEQFAFKFLRFAFMGWHVQQLVRLVQRKIKTGQKRGFVFIQRGLRKDHELHTLLQKLVDFKHS